MVALSLGLMSSFVVASLSNCLIVVACSSLDISLELVCSDSADVLELSLLASVVASDFSGLAALTSGTLAALEGLSSLLGLPVVCWFSWMKRAVKLGVLPVDGKRVVDVRVDDSCLLSVLMVVVSASACLCSLGTAVVVSEVGMFFTSVVSGVMTTLSSCLLLVSLLSFSVIFEVESSSLLWVTSFGLSEVVTGRSLGAWLGSNPGTGAPGPSLRKNGLTGVLAGPLRTTTFKVVAMSPMDEGLGEETPSGTFSDALDVTSVDEG